MTDTVGVIQFHLSLSVTAAEMATWSPDRIAAFFAGLAQVQAACRGESAPAPPAHASESAARPVRVPLFHRRRVLREYLAATGPATRGQILKGTAIPAGSLSALLAERTDFERLDNGLWALRQDSER